MSDWPRSSNLLNDTWYLSEYEDYVHQREPLCVHEWKSRELLTSVYTECAHCGEEKQDA
jgi:hypothetical protein